MTLAAATLRLQSLPQSRGTAATPSLRHPRRREKTAQAPPMGKRKAEGESSAKKKKEKTDDDDEGAPPKRIRSDLKL